MYADLCLRFISLAREKATPRVIRFCVVQYGIMDSAQYISSHNKWHHGMWHAVHRIVHSNTCLHMVPISTLFMQYGCYLYISTVDMQRCCIDTVRTHIMHIQYIYSTHTAWMLHVYIIETMSWQYMHSMSTIYIYIYIIEAECSQDFRKESLRI